MEHLDLLTSHPLFVGFTKLEIMNILKKLSAKQKHYSSEEIILSQEDRADVIGILLSGSAHVMQRDFWGNASIVTRIDPGDLFAEAFALSTIEQIPLEVKAIEESDVIEINQEKLMNIQSYQLLQNLLRILAFKNVNMIQKMEHITKRCMTDKILSYLSSQARLQQNNQFCIPFDRQQLADYLAVDRSALSRELSLMKRKGILDYHRNYFKLLF